MHPSALRHCFFSVFSLLLSLPISSIAKAEANDSSTPALSGAALYQNKCQGCHDTQVFTRPTRKIKTLESLGKQVRLCNHNLGTGWFDEEVDAVIHYLNQSFYHFDQPASSAPQ